MDLRRCASAAPVSAGWRSTRATTRSAASSPIWWRRSAAPIRSSARRAGAAGIDPVVPVDSVLATIVNDWPTHAAAVPDPRRLPFPDRAGDRQLPEIALAYAPACLHLVVATAGRCRSSSPTSGSRASVIKLDDTHLRFSLEETESFLNEPRCSTCRWRISSPPAPHRGLGRRSATRVAVARAAPGACRVHPAFLRQPSRHRGVPGP